MTMIKKIPAIKPSKIFDVGESPIASTSFYFDAAKSRGPCVTGQVITGNFNQEYATQYKAASNTAMQCLFSGGLINF